MSNEMVDENGLARVNLIVGRHIIPKGKPVPVGTKLQPRGGPVSQVGSAEVESTEAPNDEPHPDADMVVGSIPEVKERVGDDQEAAARALAAEQAGENRSSLIAHLTALVGGQE